ncbi:MAG: hypothetical protein NUV63_02240, partial [Gallionella sp.]|nr:hypothetical protein [Gallionella sp.]
RERRRPRRQQTVKHTRMPTRTSALPVLFQRVGWLISLISGYFHISSRVDKRSASALPAQKGGCAALIHPTIFAENKFTL